MVNGHLEGDLPRVLEPPVPSYCGDNHHIKCDSEAESHAWVRRGLSPADLVDGANTIKLQLDASKQVALDRLSVEVDER